jgi:hypothetical protein
MGGLVSFFPGKKSKAFDSCGENAFYWFKKATKKTLPGRNALL